MGCLFVSNDLNLVRLLCDRGVIAVSCEEPQATKQSRPIECSAARDCFAALAMTVRGRRFDLIEAAMRGD